MEKATYPVLIKIGAFELRSYGLTLAISVALGIWIAMKRASRFGIKKENILDLAVVIMIATIVGSRLWYVVYHIKEFRGQWLNTINPFQNGTIGIAGLSMVGGVVLGIISALGFIGFTLVLWLERKSKISGFTFWLVFCYYAMDRFTVDQFRYYESPQVLATLGPITFNANPLLLLGLFLVSAWFLIRGWRQRR